MLFIPKNFGKTFFSNELITDSQKSETFIGLSIPKTDNIKSFKDPVLNLNKNITKACVTFLECDDLIDTNNSFKSCNRSFERPVKENNCFSVSSADFILSKNVCEAESEILFKNKHISSAVKKLVLLYTSISCKSSSKNSFFIKCSEQTRLLFGIKILLSLKYCSLAFKGTRIKLFLFLQKPHFK